MVYSEVKITYFHVVIPKLELIYYITCFGLVSPHQDGIVEDDYFRIILIGATNETYYMLLN